MDCFGIIDIGSSSIRLLIAEQQEHGIRQLEYLKQSVSIGKNTFLKGTITQETIRQAITILENYQRILQDYAIQTPRVIATTAVREASNRDMFIDTVARATGLHIDVLTPGDVVYYMDSYLSHQIKAAYPVHEKNLLIAELSSASLDISIMEKGYTLLSATISLGALRIKQLVQTLEGSQEEVNVAVTEYIDSEFAQFRRQLTVKVDDIMLIDENHSAYLRNFLSTKKERTKLYKLSMIDAAFILQECTEKTSEEITERYGIPAEQAETFSMFARILYQLYTVCDKKQLYVVETTLAEAILVHTLRGKEETKQYNKTNQLLSTVAFLCSKFNADAKHAAHVAALSRTIFEAMQKVLGLHEDDLLFLELAAYLHDIGGFIHTRSHHKHSEYIIASLNLFRLTEGDIRTIAAIARYHRKAAPNSLHLVYNALTPQQKLLVQKLSAILRIANALDCSHTQKITRLEVTVTAQQDVTLTVHTQRNMLLEKAEFLEKKEYFEEITGSKISLAIRGGS